MDATEYLRELVNNESPADIVDLLSEVLLAYLREHTKTDFLALVGPLAKDKGFKQIVENIEGEAGAAIDPKDTGTYEFENQGHMSINEFKAWAKSEFPKVIFDNPSSLEVTFETPDGNCSGYFHRDYANGEITGSPASIKSFKKFLKDNKAKFESGKS
jgi:hypothetical protein